MVSMVENDSAQFYHYGNTVFFVVRITKFVAEIHMFSQENGFVIVKHMKTFLTDFWKNTSFVKLQATVRLNKLCKYLERCGYSQEGIKKQSFMLEGGTLIDEYLYGVSRWLQ